MSLIGNVNQFTLSGFAQWNRGEGRGRNNRRSPYALMM